MLQNYLYNIKKYTSKLTAIALTAFFIIFSAQLSFCDSFFKDPLNTDKFVNKNIKITQFTCENASTLKELNLSNLINIALCKNPKTKEAWSGFLSNKAKVGKGYGAYLPTASSSIGANYINLDSNNLAIASLLTKNTQSVSVGVSLGYLLFDFGQREAMIDLLKQNLISSGFLYNKVIQDIIFLVVEKYYTYFAMQAILKTKQESENLAKINLENVKTRIQNGLSTKLDELQAESVLSEAVLGRIKTENKLEFAKNDLFITLNLENAENFKITEPKINKINYTEMQQTISNYIEKAKENNAELKSMNALVASSEANVKRVGRQGLPSLSLVGGFNRNYIFSQGSNFNVQYGYVGAQLSIPLFTGFGNLYESQAAEKDYEATLAKKEMLEQKIILEVISSYQECKNSLEMITFTNEFVKTATQAESVARERYKLGVGNLIDLISSQNYLSSAKEKQIEAKYGWLISRSRFLRAIGSLEQNSSSELEIQEG